MNDARNQLDQSRPLLPMTVVTGYLGSGKTTLINHVLANARGQRVTVLVNDFGEISLDEMLIERRDGDVISLTNGCMCCQIGGDLFRTLDRILAQRDLIDHLIVETSGVADPSKIAQIAAAEPELTDSGTLTLIDAVNFCYLHQQEMLRDTLERQLLKADLVLLTKLDICDDHLASETFLAVSQIAQDRLVVSAPEEAMAQVLSAKGFKAGPPDPQTATPMETHSVPFESWSWRGNDRLNEGRLVKLLQQSDLGIYRCKGLLHLDDGSRIVIHQVGTRLDISPTHNEFEQGSLTVIGARPGFSRAAFEEAWNRQMNGTSNGIGDPNLPQ